MNRKALAILSSGLLLTAALLFAAIPDADPTKPHAPMELLGIGPEMFADRGSAWVEAIGNVCEKAIAKLGVLAAAVILLVQNIRQKASLREVKEHVDQRLDRQRADITSVALAVNPNAAPIIEVTEPTVVTPI